MIPFLGSAIGAAAPPPPGDIPPAPSGDLAAAVSGMTLTRREHFDGTALNGQYWNILGESAAAPEGAVGPVIAFADHWGSYLHDPLLVRIENSVLKCGWRKAGSQWYAGGITSAAQYGAHAAAKWQHTFGVVRARVRAPALVANSFFAFWSMPVENAFGAWPASGEIDMCEGTTGTLPSTDAPIAYSDIKHPNSGDVNTCNSNILTNPTINLRDGQWHEIACWRRKVGVNVVFDFYLDNRLYGSKTISEQYSPLFEKAFYDLFTAQLGWWGIGTPTDDMASTTWDCDWIEWYAVASTPPPSSSNPTSAPVLQAKGLSLVWQDKAGDPGGPASDWDFFQETTGSRRADDPPTGFPSENPRRLSLVTYDGKACLKSDYPANKHGWLNYRSQYLPTHYRRLGLCVDIMFPPGFDLRNLAGGTMTGKTMFGLMAGPSTCHQPGQPIRATDVTWPEDQHGNAVGISFKYWTTTPTAVQFEVYPHVPGAFVNGADQYRLDKYSNVQNIPGYGYRGVFAVPIGSWQRVELYGQMDTNRRDGLIQCYLNGTLVKELANLDMGGWVGNRGLAARVCGNGVNGDRSLSAGTGQLVGSAGGGWKFVGLFIRDMLGGTTALDAFVPKFGGAYYAHNWRVYGAL